ncbi:MAG: tRNA (N(6)-L-threonylcarbamoyladenosine(37)-C(2))-methylthiotransferase [Candidatus Micrarchaeia archaeon]
MKVFIETYGCTLNQSDSETMRGVLAEKGVELCSSADEADVIIINTCFVKTPTHQKIVERLKKLSGRKLVVAGCMPSANRWVVEKVVPDASLLSPSSLSHTYEAVCSAYRNEKAVFLSKKPEDKYSLPKAREGVIARIPISEGCASSCSFCVTKLARPVLFSYDEEIILSEIKKCVESGFKEIQLTSMDVGAYGVDKNTNLVSLLRKIDEIDGNFLVRVGMMNPQHALRMLPELIDAFKSNKIYKFLHLPLQSGDDGVLKEMNRTYSVDDFLKVLSEFRKHIPELTLATDIIVGFPTETDDSFERTLEVIKKIQPDVVNNSKFFPRPGTRAARMKQLPGKLVSERSRKVSELCREIALEKNKQLVGKTFEVLITERREGGVAGRNHSYKQVILMEGKLGEFVNATIVDATSCYLKGIF